MTSVRVPAAVQDALDWLPANRPALLWVHVYEPHGPYLGSGGTERVRYGEEVRRADAIKTTHERDVGGQTTR